MGSFGRALEDQLDILFGAAFIVFYALLPDEPIEKFIKAVILIIHLMSKWRM